MTVSWVPVYEAGVEQALAEQLAPPGAVDVDGRVAASRLDVGDDRGAVAHGVEVVDVEWNPDLARYRQQVQHEVGRAARSRASGDAVLEGLAGQDAVRREAALKRVHHEPADLGADLVLAAVEGWRIRRSHR